MDSKRCCPGLMGMQLRLSQASWLARCLSVPLQEAEVGLKVRTCCSPHSSLHRTLLCALRQYSSCQCCPGVSCEARPGTGCRHSLMTGCRLWVLGLSDYVLQTPAHLLYCPLARLPPKSRLSSLHFDTCSLLDSNPLSSPHPPLPMRVLYHSW